MHINEALLTAYTDAGATSGNLMEAEKQALIANGAADGSWETFLRTAGFSGSVNDMLFAYLHSRGYTTGTLQDRLYSAGAALDLFTQDHPLAFMLANGGSVFDGTLSSFYTAQDKVTPCATPDVDPVGCIVVPNGSDFFQDSSPSKPVYVVNNGIPGFRAGDISGVDRHMKTPVTYGRTASPAGFTFATVRKYVSGTYMRHAGPPTAEPNHVVMFADNANVYWYDTGNLPQLAGATPLTIALEVFTVIPSGDDAGVYLYRYSLDGLVNDASGKLVSMNLNERPVDLGTSDWCFGGNLFNTAAAVQEIYFDLVANQPATAADVAAIRAYAMSTFGALT